MNTATNLGVFPPQAWNEEQGDLPITVSPMIGDQRTGVWAGRVRLAPMAPMIPFDIVALVGPGVEAGTTIVTMTGAT